MIKTNPRFADLIPPLVEVERDQLENNLVADGCRDPLVLWRGMILDGHHRYRICQRRGISFKTVSLDLPDEDAACVWVIQNQFGRRNLPVFVRAELALKLEPLIAAKAKEKQQAGGKQKLPQKSAEPIETREELAKLAGLSHDTITKIEYILKNATPEIQEVLRKPDAPSINKVYRETKLLTETPLPLKTPQFPTDRYRAIVIDPPWPIQKIQLERRPNEREAMDYATEDLDKIIALPIPDLAEPEGCHIYLWVTHKFLPFGFKLFEAWGVRYECLLTWNKPTAQPLWWRYLTEHCLFGKVGSLAPLKKGCAVSFSAPQQRHSHKPEEFFGLVRTVSPEPRLTMFDCDRAGFTQWGIKHA